MRASANPQVVQRTLGVDEHVVAFVDLQRGPLASVLCQSARPVRANPTSAELIVSARWRCAADEPMNISTPGTSMLSNMKGMSSPWQAPRMPPKTGVGHVK